MIRSRVMPASRGSPVMTFLILHVVTHATASRYQPDGRFAVTATTTWEVTWSIAGGPATGPAAPSPSPRHQRRPCGSTSSKSSSHECQPPPMTRDSSPVAVTLVGLPHSGYAVLPREVAASVGVEQVRLVNVDPHPHRTAFRGRRLRREPSDQLQTAGGQLRAGLRSQFFQLPGLCPLHVEGEVDVLV